MFGVNAIATVNMPHEGGVYDQLIDVIQPGHIRYPGGTVTERYFDPRGDVWSEFISPNAGTHLVLPDNQQIQTLKQVVEYAATNNLGVKLVLPTEALLVLNGHGTRVPDYDLIDKMLLDLKTFYLEVPQAVKIDTIEIGNEYYYEGRMSALEYANLVNYITPNLEILLQELEDEASWFNTNQTPDIAVQTGAGWNDGDNATILSTLTDEAKAAIDTAIVHYYPRTLDAVGNFDRHMNGILEWRQDPLLSDVDYFASEWNIQNTSSSDKGFFQASSLGSAFDQLLSYDVNIASIWGTQYRSLDSRLSTLSSRDENGTASSEIDTDLTAAGEVFLALRSATVGLRSLTINPERIVTASWEEDDQTRPEPNILLNAFGNQDRAFLMLSSRESNESSVIDLHLINFFEGAHFVSIRALLPVDDPSTHTIDESDPNSPFARADLDYIFTGSLAELPELIELPPGAILFIDVQFSTEGVRLEGQNPISDEVYIDSADLINGSRNDDTIIGHNGNDTLNGNQGNDILIGGLGNDRIYGGAGNDLIIDTEGEVVLFGGTGDDVLVSAGERANVNAGGGDDLIVDFSNNSNLIGGDGNDTFLIFSDRSLSSGGQGDDLFFLGSNGHHTVTDYSFESGDRIYLSTAFFEGNRPHEALAEAEHQITGNGNTVLNFGNGSTLLLRGVELSKDELISQVMFEPNDHSVAVRAGDVLNRLNADQVSGFTEGMSTEQLQAFLDAADPSVLLNQMSPEHVLHFALGMNELELTELISDIGADFFASNLISLSTGQSRKVLQKMEYSQFEAISDQVGLDGLLAWQETLDPVGKALIADHAAVFGIALGQTPEPTDNGEPDGELFPWWPTRREREDDSEDEDENEEADGIYADCFIACTVYRDVNHPDVWLLRWFRDMVLRKRVFGRFFVKAYWVIGPSIAELVAHHPLLRKLFYLLIGFAVRLIAFAFNRKIERQKDHVFWSQNEFKFIRFKDSASALRKGKTI
jgi:hypothetical protein